jgi:molybdopterin biosynthesis enzyme
MRPFTSTISIDEARRLLVEHVFPIERTERVSIEAAAGRVAAAAVVSTVHVPPFARSAMDGYARPRRRHSRSRRSHCTSSNACIPAMRPRDRSRLAAALKLRPAHRFPRARTPS